MHTANDSARCVRCCSELSAALMRKCACGAVEGVTLEDGTLESLSKVASGDLRKAITTLQSAVRLRGSPVAPQTVLDVAGAVPDAPINSLLQACKAGTFAPVQQAITNIIADGFPVSGGRMGDVGRRVRGRVWTPQTYCHQHDFWIIFRKPTEHY